MLPPGSAGLTGWVANRLGGDSYAQVLTAVASAVNRDAAGEPAAAPPDSGTDRERVIAPGASAAELAMDNYPGANGVIAAMKPPPGAAARRTAPHTEHQARPRRR